MSQNSSFRTRSSQAIAWLSTEKLKETPQKEKLASVINILQHKMNQKNYSQV